MSFSKVLIHGRLARENDLTYSQQGKAMLKNTVAFERYSASAQKKETSFLDFVAFGKQAETISKYFMKGSLIFLDGELDQMTWTDKQTGQNKSKLRMIVKDFDFCAAVKNPQASQNPQYVPQQQPQQQTFPQKQQGYVANVDDVPF